MEEAIMSDIILVEPCAFYILGDPVADDTETTCRTRKSSAGLLPASHTHAALYEWIRKFLESGWGKCRGATAGLCELVEAETALRELIALDESQVYMHRITSCHLACLQREKQRWERELAMREAVTKYQLQRLLHLEHHFHPAKGEKSVDTQSTLHQAGFLMKEMQECLAELHAPVLIRAQEAQKFAEDRLQALMRVLEHQTGRLRSTQKALNDVCLALNDLAARANVEARCKEGSEIVHAAIREEDGVFCTPKEVIDAVQERITELEMRRMHTAYEANSTGATNDTFDALTVAVCRLEETRADFYALGRRLGPVDSRVAPEVLGHISEVDFMKPPLTPPKFLSPSLSFSPSANVGPKGFVMESHAYEIHQAVLHEQRELVMMLNDIWGMRPLLLRLCTEDDAEQYAQRPLSLYAGHSLSLHQWIDVDGNRPTKRAAVFYPTPPERRGEVPKEHLESVLVEKAREVRDALDIIDLRAEGEKAGAYFTGNAAFFSADGKFMYCCCGTADTCTDARRTLMLHVVGMLRRRLGVPSANCFCYYSSSFPLATSLGWVGAGVCAWALDEMRFASHEEKESFMLHLRETYRTVIRLTREEVRNFAGECVEIISYSPNYGPTRRRLVISSHALRSLSEHNRSTLMAWYGEGGCIVPDLSTIERMGGYSARSMLLTVVTHGSDTPPPSGHGFFSFIGIRARERESACMEVTTTYKRKPN
ncbi:hypothetical protein C3747_37g188 [Trypanosoma cruzi]|uniref:Uncharacterized protein n=2 Tax=Trypanosoma cruzi TaxID=5693 RepID=Q4DHJ1_TRYCC|nr:hypothetical protein Tc00.1047053506181.130 [Trypanosoma cruzi]EAN92001.1 hypothetical protein Tc00.1047053506181.130 [Trypanosoma cruzi]PWV14378.1 hypothetical protein C3747_37g188 [Trypanosoma cruzi]RNC59187.1 linear amidine hydrolase [Trypanosoma cruzi]|eukprot:XP_813852.1 hypothetical protein [Trypanosoma cruzi strain CL Brener]